MTVLPVQLALAGELVDRSAGAGALPGPRDSRVGGPPVLPGEPAEWRRPACGSCGDGMALVMQVHAPLLPSLPDRCLLVFGCVRDACGRREGAWAAVRVQAARRAVEPVPRQRSLPPPPPPAAAPVVVDDWGLPSGGAFGGDSGDAFDLGDVAAELASATAALAAARPRPAPPPPRRRDDDDDDDGAARPPPPPAGWTPPGWASPALAEFYVAWSDEPPAAAPAAAAAAPAPGGVDDAHVAALLAAYQARGGGLGEGGDEEAVPTAAPSSPSAAADASPSPSALAWAGETYEPDAAPGASPAYLAFARRLARAPRQVARYGDAAAPPWPLDRGAPSPPPPCPACGADRAWEVALVSPLAALLDEAAAMAAAAGGDGGGGDRGGCPAGWEWSAVAVATCVASCGGEAGVTAVAEHVAVANE